ncbi:MAG: PhoU domain-containing protein [Candidatus Bathyarchaeota archaeon]
MDLAYSALLLNDRELAGEVIELRERVSDIKTLLMMNTAIVIHDAEDAEAMVGIMPMGTVADRISDAAGDIAQIVLRELGVDPIFWKHLLRRKKGSSELS